MSELKAASKLILLSLWIALWFGPVWLAFKLGKSAMRNRMVHLCSNGMLRIIGVRVTVTGRPSDIRPLLLVSNHISYLDIPILQSKAAVHFTPKIEIAGWPVISAISRICGAVFVDRRPEKLLEMKQSLHRALAGGDMISLFPESTTGNGIHMHPFKSGFFSLAEELIDGRELTVQPAAITYSSIHKLPIDTTQWPLIAWYGDMELVPHLWNLLKLTPIDAELVFLPPVTLSQHGDRKKLAAHCQQVIGETIQSLRSRQHDSKVKHLKFHPRFLRVKN